MAKSYLYEHAVGNWEQRANLDYVPIDRATDKDVMSYLHGVIIPEVRLPYRMEDTGTGVYYVTYSSDEKTRIIRITITEG